MSTTLERRQQASQLGEHSHVEDRGADRLSAAISEVRRQRKGSPLPGVADEHRPDPRQASLIQHGQLLADQGVERMGND